MAVDYARLLEAALAESIWDRAVLAAFAELVLAAGGGPVADVGCSCGIDLSPGMVEVARQAHPGLRFAEGSMTALDLAGDSLRGLVAWYSVIHIPPEDRPAVLAEFRRVLGPGGQLLLAFQVGDERRHVDREQVPQAYLLARTAGR